MKKTALLLLVLLCAAPAFAQTAFYSTPVWFPHIDIGGDPNGAHYVTLVQASNNTSSFVTATLVVYSDAGTQMSASFDGQAPSTSLNFTLDSGATRQIQVSLSGAITAGWLQITYSPAPAQTNVILQYLSGSSVLTEVGIDPFYGQMSQTYFPVETSTNLNTGIAIASPNVSSIIGVQLTDQNSGNLLANTTISLPPNGHTAKLLTDLFPTAQNINQTKSVLILTSCSTTACTAPGPTGFIATALRLNLSSNSFTAVPVVQASSTGTLVRVLPHIAFGGSPSGVNFQTTLYLTTFSGFTSSGTPGSLSGVTGQASMFNDNGNPIAASANGGAASSSFTFSVLSNRVTKIVLTGSSTLQAGWIQITLPSQSTALVVNAVFQTYQGSTLTSEASVLEAVQDTEGMMYVNVQPGVTNIGVALANPSQTTSNTIALTLYNSTGFVAGTQVFTLAPAGHLAQYITDIFPQLAGTSFTGTLSMQSGASFSSVALRQNGTNSAGGVPGFAVLTVSDSLMYVPSITNLQITSTNRTTGQVNFTITVADFSASLVTPTAAGVFGEAAILFANTNVQADDQTFTLDGSSMANVTTGTLSGTFTSAHTNIPSGTQATFEIYITDAAGNYSNVIGLPFKF
jgi:hypothetical protein